MLEVYSPNLGVLLLLALDLLLSCVFWQFLSANPTFDLDCAGAVYFHVFPLPGAFCLLPGVPYLLAY